MKFKVLTVALFLSIAVTAGAQNKLKLEVYTSPPNGYSVTSTIISGPNEVMVIDPQFLLSEAGHVIDRVHKIGKPLTLIYSTHAHPDHMFGVAALKKAFPNARYVAAPEAIERAKTGWPARRNFWITEYGELDLPSAEPVLAQPLDPGNTLKFEGEALKVTKEVMGADGAGNSFVYIPSLQAVVAGDIIFHNAHFGIPADLNGWNATIAQIDALKPKILVAGHQTQGTNNNPAEAVAFMRGYIADIQALKQGSTNAAEYEAKILKKYPRLALADRTLPRTISAAFPKQ